MQTDQIEAEVGQIMRGIYDSLSRMDVEPWLTTLHEHAGLWALGMDLVDIREASTEYMKTWSPGGEDPLDRQEIDDLDIRVTAISPTVAYVLCTSPDRRWCYTDGRVERAGTAETWVFVLTDDGWKLHSGQSAIFPIEE